MIDPVPPRPTPMQPTVLRGMSPADAASVLALQQRAYPSTHWESWAVLGAKLALHPAGCWVAVDAQGTVQAYLFSHPWQQGAAPALHGKLTALPAAPDCYALHDLALAPEARGQGLAQRLLGLARAQAEDLGVGMLSLVAVQGSAGFWRRQGFEPLPGADPALARYGADAVAMVLALTRRQS